MMCIKMSSIVPEAGIKDINIFRSNSKQPSQMCAYVIFLSIAFADYMLLLFFPMKTHLYAATRTKIISHLYMYHNKPFLDKLQFSTE